MGERARRGRTLREAAVVVVRDRRAMIAIVVESDERADDLRIGNALGHARIIPAATGRLPRDDRPLTSLGPRRLLGA